MSVIRLTIPRAAEGTQAEEGGKVKAQGIIAIGFIVLALVVAVGSVFLANSHVMPPMQKVEQSIPDDHIPR